MKSLKLISLFFLLLVLSTVSSAQYTYQIVLRNATAVDSSTSANIIGSGAAFHNLTWNVSGTVSSCSVRVDGSTDGITWGTGDIIGATTCTSNGTTISSSTIKNYVRINLVTLTGAGATFTANLSGYITQPSGGGTLTSLTCGTGITCSPGSPITSTGTISASGSGGALVQIESHTASSSATLDFTTCFTSTYHNYELEFNNLVPATNAANLQLLYSTNGGSTWDSTSGHYASSVLLFNSGGNASDGSGSTTNIAFSTATSPPSNTANLGGISGNYRVHDPLGAHYIQFSGTTNYVGSGTNASTGLINSGTYSVTTGAVNAFRILFSSGNIASGTVTCYGLTP